MKKLLIVLSFSLIACLTSAQSWISSSQITTSESIFEISSLIDDAGNVVTFGYFEGVLTASSGETLNSYGLRDYYIIKFDSNGEFVFMHQFGSINDDYVTGGLGVDSNGDIYVSGGFQGYLKYSETDSIQSFGSNDVFLIKINSIGDISWGRNAGKGALSQYPTALTIDNSGDILLAGTFDDSLNIYDDQTLLMHNTKKDSYYAKFNSIDGELAWIKQAKTISVGSGSIWDIAASDDSYYFAGIFLDSLGFENDTITSEKVKFNVYLLKTDLSGTIEWSRRIEGNKRDYCYSIVLDDQANIYVAGFYESDTLFFDSNDSQVVEAVGNNGLNDLFIAKYLSNGDLSWQKTIGGKGDDRVFAVEYFDEKVYLSGKFADTLSWGGTELITNSSSDSDMFTGSLDPDGNFRDANSFGGEGNSAEESRGIFQNGDKLYNVLISNSLILQIGDSIYTSDGLTDYIILGVIGCLPISVDNTIYNNVETCFGDSTGSIQISATGGFGSPWTYSIDNGSTSSANPFFADLPAGDYQVVVVDAEGCAQTGLLVPLTQPDTLEVQVVSTEDITDDHDGSIVVVAQGGSAPYTYWLQPDGAIQGFGTFTFATGDSGTYVVAVDDLNGCGPVTTDSLLIQEIIIPIDTTGFETLSGVKARVYPNPTSGNLTVEMPFEGRKCQMEVISMTGQVVLKRKVFTNGGVINETLDLSDQAKGLYMLRIDGQTLQSAIMVK